MEGKVIDRIVKEEDEIFIYFKDGTYLNYLAVIDDSGEAKLKEV